jgi:glycosyltransferase involved in cell wall biosynthesis
MSPRKPRLCFAIWSFNVGGAERLLIDLLKSIPRDRYELSVVCLREKGIFAHELEAAGISVLSIGKRRAFAPAALLRLYRHLRAWRPDVLNTHLWTADLWARLMGLLAGVRHIVVTEHNVDVWKSPLRRLIDRMLFNFTDLAICVGPEVRSFYVDQVGYAACKTVVIMNGIDVRRYGHDAVRRETLGAASDDFLFVCAARLHPQKAIQVLIEAVRVLVDQRAASFRVLIVGDGSERPALEAMVRQSGLQERVLFLGTRQDVPQILAAADAFVLPSDYEGTSIAILEAMATALPVVATDVGANRVVLGDGDAGLVVPVRRPDLLAQGMLALMNDRPAAVEMGRRGRVIAGSTYGIAQTAIAVLERFDGLLDAGNAMPRVTPKSAGDSGGPTGP